MLFSSKLVYISISIIISVFIICITALSFSINTNIVQKKYLIIETENKVTKRFDIVYKDLFAGGNDSLKEDSIKNTGIPDSSIIKLKDNSSALFFNRNPIFLIWCLLISIMEAVSVGFLPIYIMLIYRIFCSYKIKRSYLFSIIISVILIEIVMIGGAWISDPKLMSAPEIIEFFNILIGNRYSIKIAVLIPQISAMFGIMALLMIPCATDRLKEDIPDIDMIKETAKRFETLNSYTNFCLLSLSVIIVLTVLTTGAIRESILGVISVTGLDIMPREFVYAYGLFFTVLLAIIYIPVQHYIKFKGREILESLNELNEENIKNKRALESAKEKFDLKTTPAGTLSASLTVLAPFISSLLPGYLNF